MTVLRSCILLPLLALGLATATLPAPAAAQETDSAAVLVGSRVEVRLADGSVLYGTLLEADADRIVLRLASGSRVELPRADVASVRPAGAAAADDVTRTPDPNATRLFFAPTARAVPAGSGYFGVFELFFPFVTYGVTDHVNVTGGTPVLPGVIGRIGYLGAKATVVDSDRLQVAGGVLGFFLTEEIDAGTGGVLYVVATHGDEDGAVTFGAGWPFFATRGEDAIAETPLLMVGGELRSGRRTKLVTENYLVPGEDGAALTGGVRFLGERLSADAGLGAFVGGGDSSCCFPLVNFIWSFGP